MSTAFTIERLELRLIRLPLVRFFETSFGRVYDRTFVLVTATSEGVQGLGECVADADPFYSAETTATAWHIIKDFIAPLVVGHAFDHPRDLFPAMRVVRGHHMAKAAVEMAAWDLYARRLGVPLHVLLGGTRLSIESGVSIGIQDSLDQLAERIEIERAAGYRRIKIKIKPGWDVNAVEMVRDKFDGLPLMVDANAAYTLADARHLASLDRFDLMMIEQPLEYDDIRDHAALQRGMTTPDLSRRVHSLGPRSAKRRSRSARAGSSTSSPVAWAGTPSRFGCTTRPPRTACPSGTAACSRAASAGRTTSISRRCRTSRCPGDIAASRRYYSPDLIEPPIEVGPAKAASPFPRRRASA